MSFWADKLAGTPSTTPAPAPTPSRDLYGLYNRQASPVQEIPLSPQEYTPTVRLKEGSICPGCGSDKYIGTHGSYAVGCGECGYHPRFEQSGYGERSLATKPGEVTASRQPANSQTMQSSIAELNAGGGVHI